MEAFKSLTAVAVPIDADNVDTDDIIPVRLMRKSRGDGMFGEYLFRDLRFEEDGSEKPEFILNQARYRPARILVASKNYACGSSRIGAVYVHYDYGIRTVIATSIGDAFYNNCFKNGILPVRLDAAVTASLRSQLHAEPGSSMGVDLERQVVSGPDGTEYHFEVDAFAKRCLLAGLSDIAFTLAHEAQIAAFEDRYYNTMNIWLRH